MPAFGWLEADTRPLDWNGPSTRPFRRLRDEQLEQPIIQQFERVVDRQRSRVAIRDAHAAVTFGELWDGISGLAATLAAETEPGALIAILLPACPAFPLAMLACLAAGRPFVVLDTYHPPDWLGHIVRETRPSLIVTHEDALPIEARMPGVRVLRLSGWPESAPHGWRPAAMDVDEAACILFTSGSTGRPKNIVNSQRNLSQRAAQAINAAHINASDRLLTLASPSTIVGVRDVTTALLAGASIHLLDPHGIGAREILNAIGGEDITILFAFPALLRSIIAARQGRADASLRLVRVGGDTTLWSDIDTLRAWLAPQAAIQVVYAATEAPMMQWFVADECRREDARIPIGYPLAGNCLALVGEDGRATPAGEVGELVAGGRYVSLGSWVDGRLADESVEREGGARIFRTGDLALQRSDGLFERVGRKDRQVKIRGSRVDLDGVEAMLRSHAFVRDAAVTARANTADGTSMLVAYVSAREGAPAGLIDELKASMQSAAPAMRPSRFYLEPSIPRLPNSKLDTRALASLDDAHMTRERDVSTTEGAAAPVAVDDRVSRTVARVWRDVLPVPLRAADDDFFDSGGDSLKAITFVLELERALELEIPLTLLNEAPTFDRLCRALRERRAPASTPLITLKEGSSLPPVFFIHGVGGNVVEILPTARRMAYPGAVIGIRARGARPGEKPHASIEAMAADYITEIKKRQPNGPYHLCGYSSGGLAAFEIARRLSDSGDEIGLVGLFDTTMSPLRWPLRTWLAIMGRMRLSLGQFRALRLSIGAARSFGIRVAASALIASARYRPGYYDGEVTLFSPAGRMAALPDLASVWRPHARQVVVVETPGTHLTMLSSRHAEATAACLTACVWC